MEIIMIKKEGKEWCNLSTDSYLVSAAVAFLCVLHIQRRNSKLTNQRCIFLLLYTYYCKIVTSLSFNLLVVFLFFFF